MITTTITKTKYTNNNKYQKMHIVVAANSIYFPIMTTRKIGSTTISLDRTYKFLNYFNN